MTQNLFSLLHLSKCWVILLVIVLSNPNQEASPIARTSTSIKRSVIKTALGLYAYYAKWIPEFSLKIHPLVNTKEFPLSQNALNAFNTVKKELESATLNSIDETARFVVECDASDTTISATLNQGGRPVAFMSRSLQGSELHYSAVEKEATAIIEAVRKWSDYLARREFTLITDQRSVAFMLDKRKRTKIKNNKIQGWRLELAAFIYKIKYRPGPEMLALIR